jgi:hypothetical protein
MAIVNQNIHRLSIANAEKVYSTGNGYTIREPGYVTIYAHRLNR